MHAGWELGRLDSCLHAHAFIHLLQRQVTGSNGHQRRTQVGALCWMQRCHLRPICAARHCAGRCVSALRPAQARAQAQEQLDAAGGIEHVPRWEDPVRAGRIVGLQQQAAFKQQELQVCSAACVRSAGLKQQQGQGEDPVRAGRIVGLQQQAALQKQELQAGRSLCTLGASRSLTQQQSLGLALFH